ncbi:MAG: hypothetical protein ACREDH_12200 [Methylocella sp.]
MASQKIEHLRKITVAACEATPSMELLAKLEKQGKGARADLLDVYGIATKFKPDDGDKGAYVRFYGQFRAIRVADKQAFSAGQLIMPKIIEESLWGAMGSDAALNVQFAFRLGVKFDVSAVAKYVYTAESLIPPAENDPLMVLEKSLVGAKLLTAPKA